MTDSQREVTVYLDKATARLLFMDGGGNVADIGPAQANFYIHPFTPYHNKFLQPTDTRVKVSPISVSLAIPRPTLNSWVCGRPESFITDMGFLSDPPTDPTVALWMKFSGGDMRAHEFTYGGPDLTIEFPLPRLLGLDKKDTGRPDTIVSAKQLATNLRFPQNSSVTEWLPINEQFIDSINTAGSHINWADGPGIYTRFSLFADDEDPYFGPATLALEALVLAEGYKLKGLPAPVKEVLQSSSCMTIPLWSCQVSWLNPLLRHQLATTPGLYVADLHTSAVPGEALVRFCTEYCIDHTRRGENATDSDVYLAYMESPVRSTAPSPYQHFLPMEQEAAPEFSRASEYGQPNPLTEDQLAKSRREAAKSALRSHHPGVPDHPESSLVIMANSGDGSARSNKSGSSQDQIVQSSLPQGVQLGDQRRNINTLQPRSNIQTSPQPVRTEPFEKQYFSKCELCPWESPHYDDIQALGATVSLLAIHMDRNHPVMKEKHEDKVDEEKDRQDYIAATKPVEVPGGTDNRENLLVKGRFLMKPLKWQEAVKASPRSQTPEFGLIDLKYLGVNIHNSKVVRLCHNKATTRIKLPQFSEYNLSQSRQPRRVTFKEGEFQGGDDFKALDSVHEALLAVLNYWIVMDQIHPLDPGPAALFRVLLEMYFKGRIVNVHQIITFFHDVQKDNASEVVQNGMPAVYPDLVTRFNLPKYSNVSSSETVTESSPFVNEIAAATATKVLQGKRSSTSQISEAKVKKFKYKWCNQFNTTAGCPNQKTGDGCVIGTQKFRHGCNFRDPLTRKSCNKPHSAVNH